MTSNNTYCADRSSIGSYITSHPINNVQSNTHSKWNSNVIFWRRWVATDIFHVVLLLRVSNSTFPSVITTVISNLKHPHNRFCHTLKSTVYDVVIDVVCRRHISNIPPQWNLQLYPPSDSLRALPFSQALCTTTAEAATASIAVSVSWQNDSIWWFKLRVFSQEHSACPH